VRIVLALAQIGNHLPIGDSSKPGQFVGNQLFIALRQSIRSGCPDLAISVIANSDLPVPQAVPFFHMVVMLGSRMRA
jgi:hypothetical protein